MKLTLNEEQNGLKLIQVNDGFVIVDMNKTSSDGGFIYDIEFKTIGRSYFNERKYRKLIIFATLNLNLEGVPVIEEKIDFAAMFYNLLKETYPTFDDWIEAIEYKKQAQQNLFTEEQVREAMNKILLAKHSDGIIDMDAWIDTGYEGAEPMYTQDEIIQSLKQPKVEITFENDKPIKCVML